MVRSSPRYRSASLAAGEAGKVEDAEAFLDAGALIGANARVLFRDLALAQVAGGEQTQQQTSRAHPSAAAHRRRPSDAQCAGRRSEDMALVVVGVEVLPQLPCRSAGRHRPGARHRRRSRAKAPAPTGASAPARRATPRQHGSTSASALRTGASLRWLRHALLDGINGKFVRKRQVTLHPALPGRAEYQSAPRPPGSASAPPDAALRAGSRRTGGPAHASRRRYMSPAASDTALPLPITRWSSTRAPPPGSSAPDAPAVRARSASLWLGHARGVVVRRITAAALWRRRAPPARRQWPRRRWPRNKPSKAITRWRLSRKTQANTRRVVAELGAGKPRCRPDRAAGLALEVPARQRRASSSAVCRRAPWRRPGRQRAAPRRRAGRTTPPRASRVAEIDRAGPRAAAQAHGQQLGIGQGGRPRASSFRAAARPAASPDGHGRSVPQAPGRL